MNKEEAKKYIIMCLHMMKPDYEIVQLLIENGYPEEDCAATIQEVRDDIEQEEQERMMEREKEQATKINGWLALLLLNIGVVGLSCVYYFLKTDWSLYDYLPLIALSDNIRQIGMIALSVYTILAFIKREKDAVFLVMSVLVLWVVWDFLYIIISNTFESGTLEIGRCVRDLAVTCLWIVYIFNSKKISRMFPEEERESSLFDKIFVGVIFVLPVFLVLFYL